jgi:sulfonate transport system substrate-binding protein
MAASELDAGSRVLYRNPAFSSYGFLNTTDDFIAKYPEHLKRVLKVYERARRWVIAHPDDTAKIVAEESKLSVPVIKQQLTRADFSKPVPEKFHLDALYATAPILLDEEIVKKGTDLNKYIGELVDDRFVKTVLAESGK